MSAPAETDVVPIRRWRLEWRPVVGLIVAYAAIRLLHLWVLTTALDVESMSDEQASGSRRLLDVLGAWDGDWYAQIATNGYPDHLSLVSVRDDSTAPLVFPPLYPMLIRVVSLLGFTPIGAGVLLSALAGVAAVIGVYAVAREVVSVRAAWLAGVLWAAGPMTIVLTMAYSEALFVALAAWALWLARRGWWIAAGLLGLLSGLTRSTGLAVGGALVVAAAIEIHTRRRSTALWRPILGAALAMIGVPLWWLYVAIIGGRVDAWFATQEFFWGSRFDFGAATLENGWRMLTFEGRFDAMTRFVYTAAFFAILIAVALLVLLCVHAWRVRRTPSLLSAWWPIAAYAAALVVLAAGSAGFPHSKMRFLIPMFPLLLLPAARLAHAGRIARASVIVVLAGAGGWLGAYMLTVWPYAI